MRAGCVIPKKVLQKTGRWIPLSVTSVSTLAFFEESGGREGEDFNHRGTEEVTEFALGMHLLRFEETLEAMTHDLLPSHLTDYLYGLAEKFHAFFRDCRVEDVPQQTSRLLLADVTTRTLAQGLSLLGIPVVEKM